VESIENLNKIMQDLKSNKKREKVSDLAIGDLINETPQCGFLCKN
jgi:hypothetical protein